MPGWLPPPTMNQSGFLLAWDEDHRPQLPLAERVIDVSSPDQDVRYASQPRTHPHKAVATHTDPAVLFQHSTSSQHFNQPTQPSFSNFSPRQSLENQNANHLLTRILSHFQIAIYRDGVCNYLRLTVNLWEELYNAPFPSSDHHFLQHCLSERYGKLPADLWGLINKLREQHDFRHLQDHFVNVISSRVTPRNPPQTPLGPSAFARRSIGSHGAGSAFSQSGDTSPILFRISSPVMGQGSQTTVTTPLSAGDTTGKPQTPYRRTKGRAPGGRRYKCPYTNCKHEPFRNAGNFNNHMRSCHAESVYRNQDPAEFLLPDLSPQPSNQGDWTSSVGTNASNSPLDQQRLFHESGIDSGMAVDQNVFEGMGDMLYFAGQDMFTANTVQSMFDHGSTQELPNPLVEGFGSGSTNHEVQLDTMTADSPNDVPRSSPADEEPVGFGQFQMIEQRRRSTRKCRLGCETEEWPQAWH